MGSSINCCNIPVKRIEADKITPASPPEMVPRGMYTKRREIAASILLTGMFQWAVRLTADFETQMVSAERVFEYGKLDSEAELKIPGKVEDKTWPQKGR